MIKSGILVVDDCYRILSEYQNKTSPRNSKKPGDLFIKWALRHAANAAHVNQVHVNETAENWYLEFPDLQLQERFDPSDRVFAAVAHADPQKPPIWQATDSKWRNWQQQLSAYGIEVDFLCASDISRFYNKKFANKTRPWRAPSKKLSEFDR
ncbi:MAG: hypothetical protein ACKOF9_15950 [Burkholderiales bacterium]